MNKGRNSHALQMVVGAVCFIGSFFVNHPMIFAALFLVGLCLFVFGFFMFVRKADEHQK